MTERIIEIEGKTLKMEIILVVQLVLLRSWYVLTD
jgi:hypothetical protein